MNRAVTFLKDRWVLVSIIAAVFLAGGVVGWILRIYIDPPTFRPVRETVSEYKLIKPFLYLDVPESTQPKYLALKSKLNGAVERAIEEKRAADVSVYFRDVNSGQWVAVNREHKFALASMLKVLTVITVLHQAEKHPNILTNTITLTPQAVRNYAPQVYAPPQHPIQAGTYTIKDLLWHNIVESDNLAENALEAYIGQDALKQTFNDLNIPVPPNSYTDFDTTQQYSRLFRVLYGATYLSRENSEYVLDLLTRTTFNNGIVAPLPTGTLVAHKFGENIVPIEPGTSPEVGPNMLELHDCGIVYSEQPYFICVTTKGDNFDTLAGVIREMSAITWGEVAKHQ